MNVRDLMKILVDLDPEALVAVDINTGNGSLTKELSDVQLKTRWHDGPSGVKSEPKFKTPYLQVNITYPESESL